MKRQEFEELKELGVLELEQKRSEIAKNLFDQRIQVRLGQTKNTSILKKLRKEIAQINTLIQQKRMSMEKGKKNGSR